MKNQVSLPQMAGTAAFATVIFFIDVTFPLGVAAGVLYVLLLLATLNLKSPRFTITAGCCAVVLVLIGLLLSPEGGEQWKVLINRTLSVVAIVVTTLLVLNQIKARQKLEENEERLNLALEAADEGIWDWVDIEKEEEWWSPKFFHLLGYATDELVPSSSQFRALLHPEDQERTFSAVNEHLNDHTPFDVEYRLKTKAGEYRWFRGRATSVRSTPNGPVRMIGSIDDITEQKKAQSALREQNSLLSLEAEIGRITDQDLPLQSILQQYTQAVVDHVDAAFARIWTHDPAKDILALQASAGLYAHLDGPHSRIPIGHFKIGLIASERKPHLTNSVIGDPLVADQEWAKREGMVAFAGFPLLTGTHMVGVLAIFSRFPLTPMNVRMLEMVSDRISDTIELLKTRQAHQELFQQHQGILDSAGDGIWGLDLQGNTTFVNASVTKLLGYTREELIGTLMHAQVHHTHTNGTPYPKETCPMYAAYKDGTVHHVEDEVLWRKDGTSIPVSYTSTPKRNQSGQITGAVVVFQDITDRKKAEQLLAKHIRELEISNQELDDFAYITSHDLKEPLRGISNYSRFLIEDYGALLPEQGKEQCETIIRLVQRMENLIEALRHFSRLGRTELAWEPVDFDEVISDIALNLKPRLEETQTTLRRPSPLPTWPGDAPRIREALANLVTNAMKYNDKTDKWIEITAKTTHHSQQLEIAIQDNGIGILEKHQKDIFRIFRRLHGRDKFGGGDGSGLTIVKKIIERHGGSIHVKSEVGVGSTFLLTLPYTRPFNNESMHELSP